MLTQPALSVLNCRAWMDCKSLTQYPTTGLAILLQNSKSDRPVLRGQKGHSTELPGPPEAFSGHLEIVSSSATSLLRLTKNFCQNSLKFFRLMKTKNTQRFLDIDFSHWRLVIKG